MTVGPLLARLRRATGPLHDRLDTTLRVVDRLASPVDRDAMIAAYGRLHGASDQAMRPWLAETPGLDYPDRRAPSSALDAFPVLASEGEALGAFYVLEGATLGGRIIQRELTARGASLDGLEFLNPYGDRTGERWRSFIEVLEERGAADPDGVERGAVAAFGFAESCLREKAPND